jgi:hypothetical protein
MWVKQWHKPTHLMGMGSKHTTYKMADDWEMVYDIGLLTL